MRTCRDASQMTQPLRPGQTALQFSTSLWDMLWAAGTLHHTGCTGKSDMRWLVFCPDVALSKVMEWYREMEI